MSIDFGERSMTEPVDTRNIMITLRSKQLHREKFDEMGQQFTEQEEKKNCLKRKAVQTSTPAKRAFIPTNSSISFISSPNLSQSQGSDGNFLSQSSGYCSQSSMISDC